MTKNSETKGLYLGKFAPFHKGHQHVVDTALNEVDDLVMLLYDVPNLIDVPALKRKKRIEQLYPEVEVLIAWGGPRKTGYTEEMKRKHEEYVNKRMGNRNITHFFSSEFYGEHMSEGLDAIDYRVDPDRETVPISGTKIRKNPYENRDYLDPIVYFDMLHSHAVVGGKITSKEVKQRIKADLQSTQMLDLSADLVTSAEGNNELESTIQEFRESEVTQAHNAEDVFATDAAAINLYSLTMYFNDKVPDMVVDLAMEDVSRYDDLYLKKPENVPKVDEDVLYKIQRSFLETVGIDYQYIQ